MVETIEGLILMLWCLFLMFMLLVVIGFLCSEWRERVSKKSEPIFLALVSALYGLFVYFSYDWLWESIEPRAIKLPLRFWVLFGWAIILSFVDDYFREKRGLERRFDID